MSVTLPLPGVIQPPETTLLSTTSQTDVFTASDKTKVVVASISVANSGASSVDVTLEWNDGSSDHVFWMKAVGAKSTEIISDLPLSLTSKYSATEKIKATASSGGDVSITVISIMDVSQQGR